MFSKILIANRGEIAVRIIRACKEMGILTVAVYSEADRYALHVALADESYCIGPAQAGESYLNEERIISAALVSGAQAIHPGYGFLSENPHFARLCAKNGVVFIGPDAESMEQISDKAHLKKIMQGTNLKPIPGTEALYSIEEVLEGADKLGYPVMLKACFGGGGRGIRLARTKEELEQVYPLAAAECESAFGDSSMYLEKYIYPARHIEVQILADETGHVVSLGERDCSMQRRNQKLLEESPSIALTQDMRNRVGRLAVKAAKSVHYSNIGTVEFLLDLSNNEFYFMEINPRIQVEHGITEAVTGIDLVRTQIRIAAGEALEITQEDVNFTGHAIECRINAEDPENNFMPCPGQITFLHEPSGPRVRFDSGVTAGLAIEPYYDSMIAKIIVHGRTRGDAIKIMERALKEFRIDGVKTTVSLHKNILKDTYFRTGNIDTQFIKKRIDVYEAAPKDTKDMNEEELANTISESMYLA